ncbi:hypothetical protein RFM26_10520 [Mesorhizobium sp. VK23B]|uniref:Uncharacterized protein n=1 Tax=Mesorhizobium dulcispinae TaxID=3072316 RepID=A0ABU4XAW0_9HYPH|nr:MULTISPECIES: hypothetical protein [unclassified Mesorhizobium]MDX8466114.1 hypothetical protein [Mesorhizobium sp. VK23B]MDX8471925.1 hypothetical protein [Mesorhizobium sp. VK23A]
MKRVNLSKQESSIQFEGRRRYLILPASCIATTTIAGADQLVPYGAESVDIGRFHGFVSYAQGAGDYRVTACTNAPLTTVKDTTDVESQGRIRE